MVIIIRFSPGDTVWYWAKDGQFRTAKVYRIKTDSKVKASIFYTIANVLVGLVKVFFNNVDYCVPERNTGEDTSIKYILDNGVDFEQAQLFSCEAEAIDSIRLFPKHAQE